MDKKYLDALVCPSCKGALDYVAARQELVCRAEQSAYPIEDGIPMLLQERARALSLDERL